MFSASWSTDSPLQSFIRDQRGPAYQDLRPGKSDVTATFPVYQDLEQILADPSLDHPDSRVAQVMATASGYAYSDVGTMAMMMTRLGLPRWSSSGRSERSVAITRGPYAEPVRRARPVPSARLRLHCQHRAGRLEEHPLGGGSHDELADR